MKADLIARREYLTHNYLQRRKTRRSVVTAIFALLVASVVLTYSGVFGRIGDDWLRFDHHTFLVVSANSDGSLVISAGGQRNQIVQLIGIVAAENAQDWLTEHAVGKQATLLLQTPQTRDVSDHLLAFVFVNNQNLSVEVVKAGLAFAERRKSCEMDGLIYPAEAEARKKNRGMWTHIQFDQMPAWRKDWLKSLPRNR